MTPGATGTLVHTKIANKHEQTTTIVVAELAINSSLYLAAMYRLRLQTMPAARMPKEYTARKYPSNS